MLISPSQELIDRSYVKDYETLYKESIANPEGFWEKIAHELFWYKPWDKVLEWNYPYARWFVGAQTNIVANALDRHQTTDKKDKLALIWEAQDGTVRRFTYKQLNDEVCRFANALKSLGLKKGDRVSIYLPRVPEQNIAMLACAKIGVVHSVVFSGFSVEALKNRIIDAESKVVITTDWYPYKDKILYPKKNVDEAIKEIPAVKNVIVVKRSSTESVMMEPNRDLWWHELVVNQSTDCATEILESTDPLYILYTSGTTGKPKGIIHDHGGTIVGIYITLKWVFNLTNDDVYFCTADAGWVTGHSYIVYSPLINGITTFEIGRAHV